MKRALFFSSLLVGCSPSTALHSAEASLYLQEQLACVDKAATLDESRACRAQVRAKWGRFLDGGVE